MTIDDPFVPTTSGRPADADGLRPVPRIAIQAFCETPEVADVLEQAAADRRMAKAHVKVHQGGVAAALDFYVAAPTPNLLFVETRERREQVLEQVDQLASVCDAGTKVVLIGHHNDVALYRDLMRRGVSEYMVAPFDLYDVIREIGEIYLSPDVKPVGRTIAFIGARGGAGSSTVAHNVAFSLSRGFDGGVVLADLDLPFGTASLDFNQEPPQTLADALAAGDRVDDVFLDRLLSKCADNLSLLAAPATLDRAFDHDEMAFDPILEAARVGAPAVILDLPHLWTGWVRRLLGAADDVVITAMPDLASLRNAKNLIDQLKIARPNDEAPRLVINQVGLPKRPEIKPADFQKALQLDPAAVIPFDAALFGTATNNGQMIAEINARSPIAQMFDALAARLTGRSVARSGRKSALMPLLARLPRLKAH
ncbi:Response regulator receiver protein [uncultured Pleomorphomonas sp.]|uniref:Response regulator receiver protein n=1 Tax=uncultured Pleomorphomonas sp. TaxID=442121 RepID=A0A212LKZ1_9HYPH|nr:AAA family ATPase [uncultured Pleomorphomonas sp.]SCM78197.1 Response regulator receiver protein [uncultured Pleomorphomonas sp.]